MIKIYGHFLPTPNSTLSNHNLPQETVPDITFKAQFGVICMILSNCIGRQIRLKFVVYLDSSRLKIISTSLAEKQC